MKRKITVLVAIAALVIGVSSFAVPSSSDAATVNSVLVTLGGTTWCSTNLVCTNPIWNLGGGVTLNASDRLFLSQTGGGFNFDTSELNFRGTPTVTVNGTPPLNVPTGILNPVDPVTNQFNEAKNYASLGPATANLEVFVGYFDNIHTDACADTAGVTSGNCQPDPFVRVAGFADPAINNVFTDTSAFPNHCAPGGTVATCWDAGVIEIHGLSTPTPEPASLLLLGAGVIGLAAFGRRHLKRNA